jgi:hypothetical protein
MDRTYNIPGYIALFSLLAVASVMAVGLYDLLEFAFRIAARVILLRG